jgi:spore germination protein YaaH
MGGACHVASATQLGYPAVQALLASTGATRVWQDNSSTPHFYYTDEKTGVVNRVDYDDSQSLRAKYASAKSMGCRGVGMWTASTLNYTDTATVEQFWADLRVFNTPL